MHELASIHQQEYPIESNIIKNNMYVDDLLTGSDNLEELKTQCQNLIFIFRSAGFNLRKWSSNSSLFHVDDSEMLSRTIDFNKAESKTLGVKFNANLDAFEYSFHNIGTSTTITKRSILSATAKIFDPLGLLTPITNIPKLLIQTLWKYKVDWDDQTSSEVQKTWSDFLNQLHMITNISIPSHVINHECIKLELHGFCDASEIPYGAYISIKSFTTTGHTKIQLLTAKSRVAPVKLVSLPRLELCAATLLAQMTNKVINTIHTKFINIYHWSDSKIVLAYINSDPSRWETFVANRVAEIQRLTDTKS